VKKMPSDRITQLQEFYKDDPGNPFNLYALALEYLKKEPFTARDLFNKLLQEQPEYLPTYYLAAKLHIELDEKEKAIAIFENGIALAKKLNDTKAIRELKSAYDELMFE
jgi:tetratricopeptide (TPR) repeat protein